jgi:hypothetical protein
MIPNISERSDHRQLGGFSLALPCTKYGHFDVRYNSLFVKLLLCMCISRASTRLLVCERCARSHAGLDSTPTKHRGRRVDQGILYDENLSCWVTMELTVSGRSDPLLQ